MTSKKERLLAPNGPVWFKRIRGEERAAPLRVDIQITNAHSAAQSAGQGQVYPRAWLAEEDMWESIRPADGRLSRVFAATRYLSFGAVNEQKTFPATRIIRGGGWGGATSYSLRVGSGVTKSMREWQLTRGGTATKKRIRSTLAPSGPGAPIICTPTSHTRRVNYCCRCRLRTVHSLMADYLDNRLSVL